MIYAGMLVTAIGVGWVASVRPWEPGARGRLIAGLLVTVIGGFSIGMSLP